MILSYNNHIIYQRKPYILWGFCFVKNTAERGLALKSGLWYTVISGRNWVVGSFVLMFVWLKVYCFFEISAILIKFAAAVFTLISQPTERINVSPFKFHGVRFMGIMFSRFLTGFNNMVFAFYGVYCINHFST